LPFVGKASDSRLERFQPAYAVHREDACTQNIFRKLSEILGLRVMEYHQISIGKRASESCEEPWWRRRPLLVAEHRRGKPLPARLQQSPDTESRRLNPVKRRGRGADACLAAYSWKLFQRLSEIFGLSGMENHGISVGKTGLKRIRWPGMTLSQCQRCRGQGAFDADAAGISPGRKTVARKERMWHCSSSCQTRRRKNDGTAQAGTWRD
jgi:hypothetical protein